MNYPSTNMQGTMTSVYNLGCFAGAMSTVWTGDFFGRPRQILVGSTVIAIGGVIQAAAYGVPQMMVGRVVAGLGTGMNTATAGVWQSETSKMRSRGKLVIIQMVSMGFFFRCWTGDANIYFFAGKLHYWVLSVELAHAWVLIRGGERGLEISIGFSDLLHFVHLRHVPVPPGFTTSTYPEREARGSS